MAHMPENKLGLNWSAVERALAEGTYSGYKIGILETEKLFKELLKAKNIPGSTIERKIRYIKRFLSLPDKFDYGRNISERIVHEPHFEITHEETKHVISGYWQAMLDIEEAVQSLSLWEKITLRLGYVFGLALKNLKIAIATILATAALIWFLGETTIGAKIIKISVIANHFFVFKILFWGVIILGLLAIIGGVLYFVFRRKSRF
jgi:hypothetical protein